MRLTTACVLLLNGAFGCNSVAGINQPYDKDPAASSGAPAASGVDRFVGSWSTATGEQDVSGCKFAGHLSGQQLSLVITAGAAAGTIVVSSPSTNCNIVCGVEGKVATILTDQTCVITAGAETDTYRYTAPTTFTLSEDGAEGTAVFSAAVAIAPDSVTCSFEEKSTYAKATAK